MARAKVTVTWDLDKLETRLNSVLTDIGEELSPEFRKQFQQQVYDWKGQEGVTRRKVGKYQGPTVTEPRDIVDTGALQDSQQWRVFKNRKLVFGWGSGFVTYAGAVFFGLPYPGANGPGRDWIQPVLQRYNVLTRFVALWKTRAGSQ
jgi:hypothetical protein